MNDKCAFCDSETIQNQEIVVVNTVRILYPKRPVTPTSVLITPLRCVEHFHELQCGEVTDVLLIVKRLHSSFQKLYSTTGYNLFVNDGTSAGQHIRHTHFHFYGRSEDEEKNPFDILNDKEKYTNRPQMSEEEYRENIKRIRESLT